MEDNTHKDWSPNQLDLNKLHHEHKLSKEDMWKDEIPEVSHPLIDSNDISSLKKQILNSGLTVSELVATAWASASTFRAADGRGGANGARIRLEPQRNWEVNNPKHLQKVLETLEKIQSKFITDQNDRKEISLADLIVLGGCAAIERAAQDGGFAVEVPFKPGRMDASQEQTDIASFKLLEPLHDGFRNYHTVENDVSKDELLVNKAHELTLSVPEMAVLLGGMRVLGANYDGSKDGVFTHRPEVLSNDFFVNLLDKNIVWNGTSAPDPEFQGRDKESGELIWTATRADLVFSSNLGLRAIAEVYAGDKAKFVKDFVAAWTKVMNLGF